MFIFNFKSVLCFSNRFVFLPLFFCTFRQEVSVPCPGQQWLPGGEEEEPGGAGEGAEGRRRDERARSASQ